jgi:hypothetical protein
MLLCEEEHLRLLVVFRGLVCGPCVDQLWRVPGGKGLCAVNELEAFRQSGFHTLALRYAHVGKEIIPTSGILPSI